MKELLVDKEKRQELFSKLQDQLYMYLEKILKEKDIKLTTKEKEEIVKNTLIKTFPQFF